MGDAVRDGNVHAADLEDTIDAAGPAPDPVPTSLPVAVIAATRDHQELLPVDRQHYVITREIARGGIGRVFEARDLRLGRRVAIKELLPKNRDAARRFEREARITAKLQHPAIIHVYEAGVWPGGEPFYAMPVVSGRSLDKVVQERKTLDERLGLLPTVIAVADALAYAHNENVIHRDLKPANVLVGEFGQTVVIDWGLAKDLGAASDPKESLQLRLRATAEETASGSIVGTPAYMPPEQARGEVVDQRADVYALGALLYKVLAGAPPYVGTSSQDVVEQVKGGPPVPLQEREPEAPPELVAIVAKAMGREPADRYVTAAALAQDLKRFETGQLVAAHRYTASELVRRWLRRHRVAVGIASAAATVLIAIGVISVQRILDARRIAEAESRNANLKRANLLEERGRQELLEGRAGVALAYLVESATIQPHRNREARGFLIADAMRSFEAEITNVHVGAGDVVVAASADGRYVAIAGDGEIRLLTSDGAAVRTFGKHGITRVVTFDPASARLAAGGDDGIVRVWTLDGSTATELRGHQGRVRDIAFRGDGRVLVSTGDDATVRVWDVASGVGEVAACHTKTGVMARFAPGSNRVLTASADTTACVTSTTLPLPKPDPLNTDNLPKHIKGHTASVNSVAWSPDGRHVLTASEDGSARVWSADLGKLVVAPLQHEAGVVRVAAFSTDGQSVVTAGSELVVWELPEDVATDGIAPAAKVRRKLAGHGGAVVAAAFTGDDRYLVTAGIDGLLKIWHVATGHAIATFEHGAVVTSMALVPGRPRLVSGSRDGKARIWNIEIAAAPRDLDTALHGIAVSRDGRVAIARADGLVTLLRGDEQTELAGHLGSVYAVAFTPDGKYLVSAGENAPIVWDVAAGAQLRTLGNVGPVDALAIASDGASVAFAIGGRIEVWSITAGTKLHELAAAGVHVDAVTISAADGTIVGVGKDGSLSVWDAAGVHRGTRRDPESRYSAVAFAHDGSALVTAGEGIGHVWNVAGGIVGKVEVNLEISTSDVRAAVFTADGSRVITAGNDGPASIWDRHTGKLLGTRDRHDKPITGLALRDDTLWIASEDETVSAWDIGIDNRSPAYLTFFVRGTVQLELDDDDVVRKAR